MSEGTLQPAVDRIASCMFDVEHSAVFVTGVYRASIKVCDFPRISTLRSLFASVVLQSITAEVRQDSLLGDDDGCLKSGGHIFVALIPTVKDTDSASGSSGLIVGNVPNKQTFPLSCGAQSNSVFNFNLGGYETDLAQDPRRGAGPVAWVGNSGVTKTGSQHLPICTITWRISVKCSGSTPTWQ